MVPTKPIAMLKSKLSTTNSMIALFVILDQMPNTTSRMIKMNITANPAFTPSQELYGKIKARNNRTMQKEAIVSVEKANDEE